MRSFTLVGLSGTIRTIPAKALGAMQEELEAGFVRSLPEHVVKMQIERRNEDESS